MVETRENKEQEKIIKEIELTSDNGLIIWREIYENDAPGPWEQTLVETNDARGAANIKKDLRDRYGPDKINPEH